MAFTLDNLSIGRGQYNNSATSTSPAFHLYTSPDGAGVPLNSGYFDDVADSLAVGDMMWLTSSNEAPILIYITQVSPTVTVLPWSL